MSKFEQYISSLPQSQADVIRREVENRAQRGEIRTQENFNRILSEAIRDVVSDNLPATKAGSVSPYTRTDADVYNNFMDSVLVDLTALYKESNLSDYLIGLEESTNKDFQDTIASSIKTLKGELTSYKALSNENVGATSVFHEPFDDPGSRDLAGVSLEDGNLVATPFISEMRSFDIQSVEIIRYPNYAVKYLTADEFDPTVNPRVLQPGTNRGYWAEVCLADEIPSFKFQDEETIPHDRTFYGVMAIARITFATPISMNALMLDPYCSFPVSIPWLRYRSNVASPWNHFTSGGKRVNASGSSRIYFHNLDRAMVKTIEIPVLQTNGELTNYLVPKVDVDQVNLIEDLLNQDLRELEYDVSKYTSIKSSNINYQKSLFQLFKSENVQAAVKDIFEILGIGRRATTISSRAIVGTESDCFLCSKEDFLDRPLKYTFVYGLFGVYPLSIKYGRGGSYRSPKFNGIKKQITSATIDATLDTPSLTTIGFFLELEGGKKFSLVPRNTTRVREYVPVVPDRRGFPKAYYSNDVGTDEFIIRGEISSTDQDIIIPSLSGEAEISGEFDEALSGEISVTETTVDGQRRELNRVFPSFYIDGFSSSDLQLYRNGERIPNSSFEFDEVYRMINIPVSGSIPLYAPFTVHDDIVIEYDIDATYGPPGGIIDPSPIITTSGDLFMTISPDLQIDTTRDRKLYVTTPTTQWVEIADGEFYVTSDVVLISSQFVTNYLPDTTEGVQMFFQYWSLDDDFNGPIGRRDSTGSPDRIDLVEASSRVLNTSASTDFSIVANRFKSTFSLKNYRIELPHSPIIDYNLYNYDGTWKIDPQTGQTYIPIRVEIGALPAPILALDRTLYKEEGIPNLSPFDEFGFYEFYLQDNVLYFNIKETPLDIVVSYEYIASHAWLVIEARTNQPGVSDYTPLVKDATLRLGVL